MNEQQIMQYLAGLLGGGGGQGMGGGIGSVLSGGLGAASALNPWSAALSAIPGLIKAGTAVKDMFQAKKIEKENPWEDYQIPGAQTAALNIAQNQAMQNGVPGQQLIENRMDANAAAGARGIQEMGGSSGERLAAIANLFNNNQQGIRDLGIEGANFKMQNQRNLINELHTQAGYQDKAWDINQYQRYQAAAAKAAALRDSSKQNFYGASKDILAPVVASITKGNPIAGMFGKSSATNPMGTGLEAYGAGNNAGTPYQLPNQEFATPLPLANDSSTPMSPVFDPAKMSDAQRLQWQKLLNLKNNILLPNTPANLGSLITGY